MADEQIWDGVWFRPSKGFRLVCCDCSKVHDVDFRVKTTGRGIEVEMRMTSHPKATAARRRTYKFTGDED